MRIKFLAIPMLSVLLLALLSLPASAKNYQINVNGMVCEFCAFGLAKKLRKLVFIDSAQFEDGIKVDIENQLVYISIQEGQPLNQEVIFEAIKSGGYDPIKMTPMDEVASPAEVTQ
jgi:mercuric ion binding protein